MNELDAQINLRLWRRRIGNLAIGESCVFDGICITRASRNRYAVSTKGNRYEFGGRNMSVLTASLEALRFVTGLPVKMLCNDCHARERKPGASYCAVCANKRAIASVQQRRKQKQEAG